MGGVARRVEGKDGEAIQRLNLRWGLGYDVAEFRTLMGEKAAWGGIPSYPATKSPSILSISICSSST